MLSLTENRFPVCSLIVWAHKQRNYCQKENVSNGIVQILVFNKTWHYVNYQIVSVVRFLYQKSNAVELRHVIATYC